MLDPNVERNAAVNIKLAEVSASLDLCDSDKTRLQNYWSNPRGKLGRRGPRQKTLCGKLYRRFLERGLIAANFALSFDDVLPSQKDLFAHYVSDRLEVCVREWVRAKNDVTPIPETADVHD